MLSLVITGLYGRIRACGKHRDTRYYLQRKQTGDVCLGPLFTHSEWGLKMRLTHNMTVIIIKEELAEAWNPLAVETICHEISWMPSNIQKRIIVTANNNYNALSVPPS